MDLRGEVWVRVTTPKDQVPDRNDDRAVMAWWLEVLEEVRPKVGAWPGGQYTFDYVNDDDQSGECTILVYRREIVPDGALV